jgi:hypothetical protein
MAKLGLPGCGFSQKKTQFEPFLLIPWFAARDEFSSETSSRKNFELVSKAKSDRTGLELT